MTEVNEHEIEKLKMYFNKQKNIQAIKEERKLRNREESDTIHRLQKECEDLLQNLNQLNLF